MSSHFTVVYDACVLYPAPLRDLLMWLALTDLYRARWSDCSGGPCFEYQVAQQAALAQATQTYDLESIMGIQVEFLSLRMDWH